MLALQSANESSATYRRFGETMWCVKRRGTIRNLLDITGVGLGRRKCLDMVCRQSDSHEAQGVELHPVEDSPKKES